MKNSQLIAFLIIVVVMVQMAYVFPESASQLVVGIIFAAGWPYYVTYRAKQIARTRAREVLEKDGLPEAEIQKALGRLDEPKAPEMKVRTFVVILLTLFAVGACWFQAYLLYFYGASFTTLLSGYFLEKMEKVDESDAKKAVEEKSGQ